MSMDLESRFAEAQEKVQTLSTRPDNLTLLELYALFKQAGEGDAHGSRPGMLDMKGRVKFDAWESKKGMSREEAMQAYVDLVERLLAA